MRIQSTGQFGHSGSVGSRIYGRGASLGNVLIREEINDARLVSQELQRFFCVDKRFPPDAHNCFGTTTGRDTSFPSGRPKTNLCPQHFAGFIASAFLSLGDAQAIQANITDLTVPLHIRLWANQSSSRTVTS